MSIEEGRPDVPAPDAPEPPEEPEAPPPPEVPEPTDPAPRGLSARSAALRSFALPGLGQAALGHRGRAVVFAAPLALLLSAGVGALAIAGPVGVAGLLVRSEVLAGTIAAIIVAAIAHVAAVIDAARLARPSPGTATGAGTGTGTRIVVATLVIVLVGAYGTVAGLGLRAAGTFDAIFGPGGDWVIPELSIAPTQTPSPTDTPDPSATPRPTLPPTPRPTQPPPAWAENGRLDLLLIGSDAGPGRWMLRTDTMIVLSVDIATARAAMIGIPRNLVNVPLAPESAGAFSDGRFPEIINGLYVYAMEHPNDFPGGDARGFRALTGAIQELLAVRLDGAIVIDLNGFVDLVNALGGLWIDVPERIVDSRYPLETGGYARIRLEAGCQLLDGRHALFFARSRHATSDYDRMARQQMTLRAVRQQFHPFELLGQFSNLLDLAADHLFTTLDREDMAGLVALASRVQPDEITSFLIHPPEYPSILRTRTIERIRAAVATLLDEPAPSPSPTPSAGPSGTPGPCG